MNNELIINALAATLTPADADAAFSAIAEALYDAADDAALAAFITALHDADYAPLARTLTEQLAD